MYKWTVDAVQYDTYGARIVTHYSVVIYADTKIEMINKLRTMFGATYDSFRSTWNYGLHSITSVEEVLHES
jgi:hypothetical protein